jgi:hypothetical protein
MGIRMYVRKVSCGKNEVHIDWEGYRKKYGDKFGWYKIENGMLIDTQQNRDYYNHPLTNDFFEFVHYFNDMFPQGIYELEPEFVKLSEFVSGYCQVSYKADGRNFFGGVASVTIKVGKKPRKGARKASPKRSARKSSPKRQSARKSARKSSPKRSARKSSPKRRSARKSARKSSPKRRSSARKSARRSSARRSARKSSPKRRSSARKSSPKKKMSVADLKKLCKEKGIKGYSKLKKSQLEKKCL